MTYQFKTIDNTGDTAFNQLLAINNSGTIAGYFGDGTVLPNKGYTVTAPYTQAHFSNENFPTSAQTQVTGINNSGTTVGFWVDANGDNYGFIDQNGTFSTAIDPLAPTIKGVVSEQFLGINDAGEVAGFYVNDVSGDTSGFVYNSNTGTYSAVKIAGATSLTATDVNDKGQISGFFTKGGVTDGFVDTNGKFLVLSGPAGASDVQALGLNDAGLVVGSYMDAKGNTDGFVFSTATGTYTTVIDPHAKPVAGSTTTTTVVNGVNDQGQLVGFYVDANGNTDGMLVNPGSQTFLWEFHTHDNAADPTFNQLLAINNAGVIAGYDGSGMPGGKPNQGYTLASPYGPHSYTNENFPSSAQTQVTGINNAGETSGFWVDANGNSYGFVDVNGRFITATDPLAPTIGGVVNEQFLGLNDEGQVAGFFTTDAQGDTASFIYSTETGSFSAVKIAGATSITATDINDKGEISGYYTKGGVSAGFLDTNGKIVTLAGPAGASDVQVLGLNNAGLAVGSYEDSKSVTHGFVYNSTDGTYTTVDDPNAHGLTVVNGINDLDQLVGFYEDAHANFHGMLVTLQTLGANDLVPGNTGNAAPTTLDTTLGGPTLGGTSTALLPTGQDHATLTSLHPSGVH